MPAKACEGGDEHGEGEGWARKTASPTGWLQRVEAGKDGKHRAGSQEPECVLSDYAMRPQADGLLQVS